MRAESGLRGLNVRELVKAPPGELEHRRRQVHESVAPRGKSRPQPRGDRRDAAAVLAEVALPPGASERPCDLVVAVVAVVVHLAEHEVVGLRVERPVVRFAGARLALPEGRGVHAPEGVPHPELLDSEAVVVLGELAQPAAVPAEPLEKLEPPSAEEVAAATHSGTPAG